MTLSVCAIVKSVIILRRRHAREFLAKTETHAKMLFSVVFGGVNKMIWAHVCTSMSSSHFLSPKVKYKWDSKVLPTHFARMTKRKGNSFGWSENIYNVCCLLFNFFVKANSFIHFILRRWHDTSLRFDNRWHHNWNSWAKLKTSTMEQPCLLMC